MIDPKTIHKIVTHKDCPDGMASAMLCHEAVPHAQVVFVQYGEPEREELPAEEGLLFVDMTPPEARVDEFVEAGAWVLDHHRGAKDLVARFGPRGIFADEEEEPGIAGANLAYRHVHGAGTVKELDFALLAGIRDTWQKDDPWWPRACAQAAALTFFSAERWLGVPRCWLTPEEWEIGYRLMEQRAEKVERVVEESACHWMRSDGVRCAVFPDTGRLTSDVAERLREGWRVQLVAGFSFNRPGVMSVSLRSDGTVDVAELAKKYGGGGHTKAAGFGHDLTATCEQPFVLLWKLLQA